MCTVGPSYYIAPRNSLVTEGTKPNITCVNVGRYPDFWGPSWVLILTTLAPPRRNLSFFYSVLLAIFECQEGGT